MPILPREDYKALAGITGAEQDAKIDAFLPLIDDAIRQYTERDFATTESVETRVYQWDGRGACEIDDCYQVTNVSLQGRTLVAGTQYVLGPDREPRFYWVELPIQRPRADTAMGFTYNLDLYGSVFPRTFPVDVSVSAKFGYQEGDTPGSVRLAAFLGLSAVVESPPSGNLQAEAIDSYSRSWDTGSQLQSQNFPQELLPPRALSLLDPFVRRTGGA